MRIDIAQPEGNTLAALGIACRLMETAKRDPQDIVALTQAVFAASSAKEAREAITEATYGSITFFNSNDED